MHGTTPKGGSWHNSVWLHEGERIAPSVIFLASLGASPGEEASGLELFKKVATGNNNSCGISVELTAKRLFQTYSTFWLRDDVHPSERKLIGTEWDQLICMRRGEIAHYDAKRPQNRWSADPRHLHVVALRVSLDAMKTGSFIELM